MQTDTVYPAPGGVDPGQLDGHIVELYRDVANAARRDLHFPTGRALAEALGYPADLLERLPAEAVSSFAVGYHLALARLLPGEHVLDLGSGSGMDAFAAAAQVGPSGSVTGLDITREQLAKANRLRRTQHVSFASERAQHTSDKYGAHSVSLLALKPVRASRHAWRRDLGGGADVGKAAGRESPNTTTMTEEVSQ